MKEIETSLIVKYNDGTQEVYGAIKLAVDWLRMSNDSFYSIYGFNYVPSKNIQQIARQKINNR